MDSDRGALRAGRQLCLVVDTLRSSWISVRGSLCQIGDGRQREGLTMMADLGVVEMSPAACAASRLK